jgi:riboflavin synthase
VENIVFNKNMKLWDDSLGEGVELTVQSNTAVCDAYIGCSIAINGVCLTAVSFDDKKVILFVNFEIS